MPQLNDNALVLITGASGYLGGHVTEEFLKNGYRVRGTVRSLANPKKVAHLRELGACYSDRLDLVEADLTSDAGWKEAVQGCTFVQHVASPFPAAEPAHEDDLIRPAVDGTLRVLRAAAKSGSVRRVVLTSSIAAIAYGHNDSQDRILTENDWSDVSHCAAYPKSKTLAERAAWEFVAKLPSDSAFELTVVNPGFIAGPLSGPDIGTSGEVVGRLLRRDMPACPKLGWAVVDVRDVALMHRLATETPEAAGERFVAAGDHMWMQDIAKILESEFGPKGYRPPTGKLPYALMWLIARFDKSIRLVLPYVGKRERVAHAKAARTLGWEPRDARQTFVDMGYSMIEKGHIPSPK